MTAPEVRRAAHARAAAACSPARPAAGCMLPQVAGFASRATEAAAPAHGADGSSTHPPAACGGPPDSPAALPRPSTSASAARSDGSARDDSPPERRPLTAEGSSPYATALRQLEREQLQTVRRP